VPDLQGTPLFGSSAGLWRRLCGIGRHWRDSRDEDSAERNNDDRRLAAAADVRASAHDDGLVLLHISTGRVFLCNQTGLRIWQGVVAGLSADAISQEISRDWGVGWERVRRHTSSFISHLERRGLVIRRADSSC
jgi:hypothetical protein